MVLYCNFQILTFFGLIGFLTKAAKSLMYSYPPGCSQEESSELLQLLREPSVRQLTTYPTEEEPCSSPNQATSLFVPFVFWVHGRPSKDMPASLGFRV